jgi:cytochrome c oxidase subunit 2
MWNFPIMPPQASDYALQHDLLFFAITFLTVVFTLLVPALFVFLAIYYRRGSKASRKNAHDHDLRIEIAWSVVPLLLGIGIFAWSAYLYADTRKPPQDAIDIFVIGKQWMWHMQHPNGVRENNELHVPAGKPIKLTMISQDVIHSMYLPSFRVKQDVLPGRYTYLWFKPTVPGKYNLWCTEYCGTQHSEMGGYVYVLEPSEYERWLASGGQKGYNEKLTMEKAGEKLYNELACGNCHGAVDGPRGPSLYGIYNRQVRVKIGGREQTVLADDSYLRESLIKPYNKMNVGYEPIMPEYSNLSEEKILHLIAYMKSLGSRPAAPAGGQTPPASGSAPAAPERAAPNGSAPAPSDQTPSSVTPGTQTTPTGSM